MSLIEYIYKAIRVNAHPEDTYETFSSDVSALRSIAMNPPKLLAVPASIQSRARISLYEIVFCAVRSSSQYVNHPSNKFIKYDREQLLSDLEKKSFWYAPCAHPHCFNAYCVNKRHMNCPHIGCALTIAFLEHRFSEEEIFTQKVCDEFMVFRDLNTTLRNAMLKLMNHKKYPFSRPVLIAQMDRLTFEEKCEAIRSLYNPKINSRAYSLN